MAVTLTSIELAQVLSNYTLPDTVSEHDMYKPTVVKQAQRLLPVVNQLVTEYCRGSDVPGEIMNEAATRAAMWLYSSGLAKGLKSQKVDDLEVEYFPSQRSALKHSGAEQLLSSFKQRRAI